MTHPFIPQQSTGHNHLKAFVSTRTLRPLPRAPEALSSVIVLGYNAGQNVIICPKGSGRDYTCLNVVTYVEIHSRVLDMLGTLKARRLQSRCRV